MKNISLNWNKNMDYEYVVSNDFFDRETCKKLIFIFIAGCILSILLAVMFAGFLYGIQQKTDKGRLSYGKLYIIIITPCILLGLIAGILLL